MSHKNLFISLVIICVMPITPIDADDEINTPLIHVIMNDEIREIMRELDQLHQDRGVTVLQGLTQRVEHLNAIVEATDKLISAAANLHQAIPGISIEPRNRAMFEALAIKLGDDGRKIQELAEANNYTGMEPAYQTMQNTCEGCHRLFRF